jgi:hypothetical protein
MASFQKVDTVEDQKQLLERFIAARDNARQKAYDSKMGTVRGEDAIARRAKIANKDVVDAINELNRTKFNLFGTTFYAKKQPGVKETDRDAYYFLKKNEDSWDTITTASCSVSGGNMVIGNLGVIDMGLLLLYNILKVTYSDGQEQTYIVKPSQELLKDLFLQLYNEKSLDKIYVAICKKAAVPLVEDNSTKMILLNNELNSPEVEKMVDDGEDDKEIVDLIEEPHNMTISSENRLEQFDVMFGMVDHFLSDEYHLTKNKVKYFRQMYAKLIKIQNNLDVDLEAISNEVEDLDERKKSANSVINITYNSFTKYLNATYSQMKRNNIGRQEINIIMNTCKYGIERDILASQTLSKIPEDELIEGGAPGLDFEKDVENLSEKNLSEKNTEPLLSAESPRLMQREISSSSVSSLPSISLSFSPPLTDEQEGHGLKSKANVVYKMTKDGKFGNLQIDVGELNKGRLYATCNGKKVLDRKVDINVVDLLTKRFNKKRDYGKQSLNTWKLLLSKAQLPIMPNSEKYKMTGQGRKLMKSESTPLFKYYSDPNQLVDRMKLLMAEMDSGNNGVFVKNELGALLDALYKNHGMPQKYYTKIQKDYIQK